MDVIPAIQKINKQEQQAKKANQDIDFNLVMHANMCAGMSACFICLYSMDHTRYPNTFAAYISTHRVVLSIQENLASII